MISFTGKIIENSSEQEILELVECFLRESLAAMRSKEGDDIRYQAGVATTHLEHAESILRGFLVKRYKKDIEVIL